MLAEVQQTAASSWAPRPRRAAASPPARRPSLRAGAQLPAEAATCERTTAPGSSPGRPRIHHCAALSALGWRLRARPRARRRAPTGGRGCGYGCCGCGCCGRAGGAPCPVRRRQAVWRSYASARLAGAPRGRRGPLCSPCASGSPAACEDRRLASSASAPPCRALTLTSAPRQCRLGLLQVWRGPLKREKKAW